METSRRGQDSLCKSHGESTSMVWPTLGSRTAIRTEQNSLSKISSKLPVTAACYTFFTGAFAAALMSQICRQIDSGRTAGRQRRDEC